MFAVRSSRWVLVRGFDAVGCAWENEGEAPSDGGVSFFIWGSGADHVRCVERYARDALRVGAANMHGVGLCRGAAVHGLRSA